MNIKQRKKTKEKGKNSAKKGVIEISSDETLNFLNCDKIKSVLISNLL